MTMLPRTAQTASAHLFAARPDAFNRDRTALVYECPRCGPQFPTPFFDGWHRRECRCARARRETGEVLTLKAQLATQRAEATCDKAYTWLGGTNDDLAGKGFASFHPERQTDVRAFTDAKAQAVLFAEKVIRLEKGYVERRGINAVLLGPVGVGKTHLAASVLNAVRAAGVASRFCTAQGFFDAVYARMGARGGFYDDLLREASETPLLVLDELNRLHLPTATDGKFQHSTLFGILDARYKRKLPTLVTMNTYSMQPYVDDATESRLSVGLLTIEMDGIDYRKAYQQGWTEEGETI